MTKDTKTNVLQRTSNTLVKAKDVLTVPARGYWFPQRFSGIYKPVECAIGINSYVFMYSATKRKLQQANGSRRQCAPLKSKNVLTLARGLARWALLEFRPAGRQHWFPQRFVGIYKPG